MSMGCSNYKCPANSNYHYGNADGLGVCYKSTTSPEQLDEYAEHCGFICVTDSWTQWKFGVSFKELICGNCQYFSGGTHGKCSADRDFGLYDDSRRYQGAHACKEFKKKEGENLAKKTYWTKCGIEFQKTSTAEVTGYELKLLPSATDPLKIKDNIARVECRTCPFIIDVTEGWGENKKHIRFECRAGSQKPNHKTDWTGSLDDKNTIGINSLDHDFMEDILQYCKDHPDLNASYNSDHLADCRRTLSISCSANKKGIGAKRELIEKFFPVKMEEKKRQCVDCFHCRPADTGECHPAQHMCFNASHRVGAAFYISESCIACENFKEQEVEEVKEDCTTCMFVKSSDMSGKVNCSEHTKKKDFNPTNDCPQYTPERSSSINIYIDDPEWDDKWSSDSNEKEYPSCNQDRCPFNDSNCRCMFEDEDPQSEGFNRDVFDAVEGLGCKSEKVLKQYEAISNTDFTDYTIDAQEEEPGTCSHCGVDKGTCEAYQFAGKADPEKYACEDWQDKLPIQVTPEKKKPRIGTESGCNEMNENCPYFCKHNDGCSVLLCSGSALESIIENFGDADCDVYRKVAKKVNDTPETDTRSPEIANDLAEIDTKSVETVTFDYSTLDDETSLFLQEKARKIVSIKTRAILDMAVELEETFAKFAKLPYGNRTELFEQWVNSIGISPRSARNYIDGLVWVRKNFPNIEDAKDIQPSLLFEVSKKSAPSELQEGVKDGDITTHKQYKEKEAEWKDRFEESRKQQETLRIEKQQAITKAFDAERKADRLEGEIEELRNQIDELKDQADQDPKLISTLQDRIRELEAELKDKPIEAAAVQVVEKIPERAAHEITQRLYGTLMAAKLISIQEINVVHDTAKFEDREAIIEFMENLQEIIPGYLEILKNVPYGEE